MSSLSDQTAERPKNEAGHAHAADQPFEYPLKREYVEPDWTRLPGFGDVTKEQWESAQWQRAHTIKNLVELKRALGNLLSDKLYADIERDQQERATMSMLIPPQMINTMDETDLWADPVRRYMAPALSDRDEEFPSHPMAARDSLHEADMWAVEGLTHRYPTKVLAELIPTCPQYCGHCTRMDLVGNDTSQVLKYKFEMKQNDRWDAMLDYLRRTPSVRDVVVSGGDMANVPIKRLQEWLFGLFDIESVREVRIATKGLMGIPQHFLQDDVLEGYEAIAGRAHEREGERNAENPERHVDPEHRRPVEGGDQQPTDDRPETEADAGDTRPDSDGERAALGREGIDENGEGERSHQRCADPLARPECDQLRVTGREGAGG